MMTARKQQTQRADLGDIKLTILLDGNKIMHPTNSSIDMMWIRIRISELLDGYIKDFDIKQLKKNVIRTVEREEWI